MTMQQSRCTHTLSRETWLYGEDTGQYLARYHGCGLCGYVFDSVKFREVTIGQHWEFL